MIESCKKTVWGKPVTIDVVNNVKAIEENRGEQDWKKQWENNDSENMFSYEKATWDKSVRKYIVKDEKRVGEKWAPIRDWLHEEPSAYDNLPPHIFGETSSKNSSLYTFSPLFV